MLHICEKYNAKVKNIFYKSAFYDGFNYPIINNVYMQKAMCICLT